MNTSTQKDTNFILKTFISKYTTPDFFQDIINISLYPSDFGVIVGDNQGNSVSEYIQRFFNDLSQTADRLNIDTNKTLSNNIKVAKTLLKLRDMGKGLVTYDTVYQHINASNIITKKLIQTTIDNKLQDDSEFRLKIEEVLNKLDYYYDINTAIGGMTKINQFVDTVSNPDVSVIEAVSAYKDMCLETYNDISKLQSLSKDERQSDYFEISDSKSVAKVSEEMVNYISSGYSFFKTGLEVFDNSVEGFESSSVHLVTAPSNHAKSVMLANLLKTLTINNISDFNKNDAGIIITLEDSLEKLLRKLICIFGNYKYSEVKRLYKEFYEIIKAQEKINKSLDKTDSQELKNIKSKMKTIIQDLLNKSMLSATNGNFKIFIKHSAENTYCPGDVGRYIEKLKTQGIRVKFIIIDYLDTMSATINQNYYTDKEILGQITQELRNLARIYQIPVITATQNSKVSENTTLEMNNTQMGESYRKVRYSDYIYNQRMRYDLNAFSDEVKDYVFKTGDNELKDDSPEVLQFKESIIDNTVPLEVKITKSKDTGRNHYRYLLFCKENVKLYNSVEEYLQDAPMLKRNSMELANKINNMLNIATSSISTDGFDDPSNSFDLVSNGF